MLILWQTTSSSEYGADGLTWSAVRPGTTRTVSTVDAIRITPMRAVMVAGVQQPCEKRSCFGKAFSEGCNVWQLRHYLRRSCLPLGLFVCAHRALTRGQRLYPPR